MSVIKNYAYNLVYQIISIIIPLATAPFLSRTLGVYGVGEYSFYYSIVYYFSLFITLGVTNYGNKSVAQCLNDDIKIKKVFWEIYSFQFFVGLIVLFLYSIFCFNISKNFLLSVALFPYLLASTFDITWFFWGREDFKRVAVRNLIVKILTTICMFLFVRSASDVYLYSLLLSGGFFLGHIFLLPSALNYVGFPHVKLVHVLKRVGPNLLLFIPVIAVSVYRFMDKIMLGSISDVSQVGLYDYSEKIVSLVLMLITSIGVVMLPRMTALHQQNDGKTTRRYLDLSFYFTSFFTFCSLFALLGVADDLIIVFYGQSFEKAIPIFRLLCVTIPFICYSNIIRLQMLIPRSMEKMYVISYVVGAFFNVLLNVILIPIAKAQGAALGTIVAELTVFAVQLFAVRGMYEWRKVLKDASFFVVLDVVMMFCLVLFPFFSQGSLVRLFSLFGIVVFFQLLAIFLAVTVIKNECWISALHYVKTLLGRKE